MNSSEYINIIPLIALGIILHFVGAVITACILLKLEESKPKPEYPDEETCIELEAFLWELVVIAGILIVIMLSPYWIAKKIYSYTKDKKVLDDTKSYEHF